jgi:pSer/pThr/pTyr-binding forkhead associated (FHA) protein
MTIRLELRTGEGEPRVLEHRGPALNIGRDPGCEVHLDGAQAVSWKHARIEVTAAGAFLSDLGSTNGTYLNGRRLDGRAPLRAGDRLRLGQQGPTLGVVSLGSEPPPASATRRMLLNLQELFAATSGRYRKALVALGAAAVLLAAVGGFLFWRQHSHAQAEREKDRQEMERLATEKRELEERVDREKAGLEEKLRQVAASEEGLRGQLAAVKPFEPGAVLRRSGEAVYLVAFRDRAGKLRPLGTAFAVDARGVFATNGHVATPVSQLLARGLDLLLISQGGAREHRVSRAVSHPRYRHGAGLSTPDVGLLWADLPAGQRLPCVVELAAEDDLRRLHEGGPLCYAGFPVFEADQAYTSPA